jgi:hypothetical protein
VKTGIHIIQRSLLPRLEPKGVHVPTPYVGVLDLARTINGLLPEPTAYAPVGIVGVDALMRMEDGEVDAIGRRLRRVLHEGMSYFEWKQIPLVFLTRGALSGQDSDRGPELDVGGRRVSLSPLFGSRLQYIPDSQGWWWAPQPG